MSELAAGGDVVEDRVLPQVEGRHPRRAPGEDAPDDRGLEEGGDPRLVVPADDLAARVETSAQLMDGCRAFGIPAVLVMAHPLDADRLPDELRHQRRVDRGRIGSVAAVAARGLEGDDANVLDRDVEGVGDRRADDVGALRSRPDRGRPVLDVCDRAGRADRAVRLNRGGVLRVERTCGAGERLGRVAGACNNGVLEAGRLANVRVELVHRRQARPSPTTSPRARARP